MTAKPANSVSASPRKSYLEVVGRLRSRSGLLVLAAVALGLGAALNWSLLVAAGITPILVALLPCAAMCALGLCMNKAVNRSNASEATFDATSAPPAAPFAQIRGRQSSCDTEASDGDRRPADASER